MKGKEHINNKNTYLIHIKGLVQGVGFRPFIYRHAGEFHLKGTVENRNDGVVVKVNCDENQITAFISSIRENAPPASYIEAVDYAIIPKESFSSFDIVKSQNISDSITDISPDIAVCKHCLQDMKQQKNRVAYPFINCTNCGPRFTIIKDLPYDRDKTTMQPFVMCSDCHTEYVDIMDRRFHAQPVACEVCGPEYKLHTKEKSLTGTPKVLKALAGFIDSGKIVAVKGMGGFFMACDALNEQAVVRLRQSKKREGKPFAVMFKDVESLRAYAKVSAAEERCLTSFRRPIVLLKAVKATAPSVALGFNTLGVMLPYMPIHHLLFEQLKTPVIVLTSGNLSDEPIIIDNETALDMLGKSSDAVLTYNRDIYNRTDDSVVKVINNRERLFRRSRGYAPEPLLLNHSVDGILATGAELVNCFAIGRDNKALLSQHIGDLKNFETYEFYTESLAHFQKLFRFKPRLVVSDMHPEYHSTRYAENTGIAHIKVQHHHAHIASCMGEHGLDEKVIGVALDGTGYGDDGHIWGSEFLICNLKEYKRYTHFEYIPLPGGDKVTDEPWRTAVSYLYKYLGNLFFHEEWAFLNNVGAEKVKLLCHAIDNKINSPLSCGAGRLFDAVAALIGLCTHSSFHAEAPMRLEAIIDDSVSQSYPYEIDGAVSFKLTFLKITKDISHKVPQAVIAAKFHNTIINVVVQIVKQIRKAYDIHKVVLSGGTFQNKYLLEKLENLLGASDFDVYSHLKVPANDAGIALGQLLIGAKNYDK